MATTNTRPRDTVFRSVSHKPNQKVENQHQKVIPTDSKKTFRCQQAAKKGTLVKSFPRVLTIQLKRFEFDFYKEAMVKINDRLEFPRELELSKYMPNDAQCDAPPVYSLYAFVFLFALSSLSSSSFLLHTRTTCKDNRD